MANDTPRAERDDAATGDPLRESRGIVYGVLISGGLFWIPLAVAVWLLR